MTRLPDPSASRAVLIGTAVYQHLDQLPAVAANVRDLARTLADAMLWGCPRSTARWSRTRPTPPRCSTPYTGPVSRRRTPCWSTSPGTGCATPTPPTSTSGSAAPATTPATRPSRTSICAPPSAPARPAPRGGARLLLQRPRRRTLDGGATALAARLAVDGAYVLTASPHDRVALAPDGEPYTAFTGELLHILRRGIDNGPELIDLDTLYRVLGERLGAKNRPLPQRSQENDIGRLALVRNRARATPRLRWAPS
ncbi:hypothetical protein NKH77_43105 [Streptomyces sp. M19]